MATRGCRNGRILLVVAEGKAISLTSPSRKLPLRPSLGRLTRKREICTVSIAADNGPYNFLITNRYVRPSVSGWRVNQEPISASSSPVAVASDREAFEIGQRQDSAVFTHDSSKSFWGPSYMHVIRHGSTRETSAYHYHLDRSHRSIQIQELFGCNPSALRLPNEFPEQPRPGHFPVTHDRFGRNLKNFRRFFHA